MGSCTLASSPSFKAIGYWLPLDQTANSSHTMLCPHCVLPTTLSYRPLKKHSHTDKASLAWERENQQQSHTLAWQCTPQVCLKGKLLKPLPSLLPQVTACHPGQYSYQRFEGTAKLTQLYLGGLDNIPKVAQ